MAGAVPAHRRGTVKLVVGAAAASNDRDTVLQQAMILRAHRRIAEALAILARLERSQPRFSRLYQERGQCHFLLGNAPAAVAALREAVRLNSTLPASWAMLEQIHRALGDAVQAATAARHLAILRQLPPQILMANSLFVDGDLAPAEEAIRDFLHRDAANAGALRLLARIRLDSGAPEEAASLLATALAAAPDYHDARLDYAMSLLQQQKPLEARQQAELLLHHAPDDRAYLKQFAAACIALGDHEAVIDVYARLLADPSQPDAEIAELRLWRANALKVTGRIREAIADYRAALAARPGDGVAWFGLANLKTYRFDDHDIAAMRLAAARPDAGESERIYLAFALGKALEDGRDYAASWQNYARGNALRRAAGSYRHEIAGSCAERLQRVFTADFFAARADWGRDDPAPIFIVGLPRSGSTLIEQILASHSAVEGTRELTEIGRYAAELCGSDPSAGLPLDVDAVRQLTAPSARALGDRFVSETGAYRRLGRPLFIDKMPNNFWHIGLIHLILPRATIIDVRREPMACCFGNLKQLFGTSNQEFTYEADDIARYYRTYLQLMRHWAGVLPGRVLRVQYEDVVADLEGSVRRMLAHCGIPFEPTCLAFHATRRSVRTPSSEQVRRPIDRAGLTQWQHYAAWLAPMRESLGDAVSNYRI